MAYKIQYTPEDVRRYPQAIKKPQIKWEKYVFLLIVLAAVLWMRVKGIPDFLIPGDPVVTKAAAEMMFDELRAGEPVNDAVTVFCKEVLNGAQF